uniref:Ras-related GTP-binding protein C n=1 Tax=Caligus clemensi TaxID=344056 RepID=C1C1F9_CALCM|nr:Ras-related GTP-binding protein C [Caligus clemensi]
MSYESYSELYIEESEGISSSSRFAIYESDDYELDSSKSAAQGSNPGDTGSNRPKILLMGLRRSGKSSIHKVVFHKMSPNESLFLESNNSVVKDDISHSSYVQFSIWDFPGQIDFFDSSSIDPEKIFRGTGAIIFVIDAQDDYLEALNKLHSTVKQAYAVDPNIRFEVFIHKVDGLSDDTKMDAQRDIHQRATDELSEMCLEIHLTFYLTSIYDYSIFEAFSKVVQKLIPQLPTLENLLNVFISNSTIEKAFLFDVISKIYLATDSSPVDMQTYELCCDMIDVVIDVSCIYGASASEETLSFDHKSSSIIRLNNSTILYLKEVNKALALVCVLREENFTKQSSIDYNFSVLRKAIEEVFKYNNKTYPS